MRLPQRSEAGAGRGVEDRIRVDAVGAVEVGDVARLAKAVDTQWDDHISRNRTEPRQGRRVKIADRDEGGTRAQPSQQPLGDADVPAGTRLPYGIAANRADFDVTPGSRASGQRSPRASASFGSAP